MALKSVYVFIVGMKKNIPSFCFHEQKCYKEWILSSPYLVYIVLF